MAGRKQHKASNELFVMKPGLRAQVPDSPCLSLASTSSGRPLNYTNAGYENADTLSAGPDYEDLEFYRQATGPRKQPNIIYESAPSALPPHMKPRRHRQITECSDDSTSSGSLDHYTHVGHSKKSFLKDCLFATVLLISVASFVVVMLMAFGIMGPKCSKCETKVGGSQQFLTKIQRPSTQTGDLVERINALQKNISSLMIRDIFMLALLKNNEKKITDLEAKLEGLTSKNKETQSSKFQNITSEVQALREKQDDFGSSLEDLKSKDHTINAQINDLDRKVLGMAISVQYLTMNDSAIKNKVSVLLQSDQQIKQELASVINKNAELDLRVKNLASRDAMFNASMRGLKKFDESLKTALGVVNSTIAAQFKNITDTVNHLKQAGGKAGPPGPPGATGPVGPKGSPGAGASFTSCTHGFREKEATSGKTAMTDVNYVVDSNKVVTGVTCSTKGGDETNLELGTNSKQQAVYRCACLGKSTSRFGSGKIKCRIDYWVCPRS